MKQYSDQQLKAVKDHCLAEVEARQRWAFGTSKEWQDKASFESIRLANDAICVPLEKQAASLFDHWYKCSHEMEDRYPQTRPQWDAAIEGLPFKGEFSYFSNNYPEPGAEISFDIAPPGC